MLGAGPEPPGLPANRRRASAEKGHLLRQDRPAGRLCLSDLALAREPTLRKSSWAS
jgi:hypothetical protein